MSAVLATIAPTIHWRQRLRLSARDVLIRAWSTWRPPAQRGTREWADECLYLPRDIGTAKPGQYRSEITPWLHAIQDAFDDPTVNEVVCMKSSQVAWTIGGITAYVAKRITVDPCPVLIMFPTSDSARQYSVEKFMPIVHATPALRNRVDQRSRRGGNRVDHKAFPGGFLKMVGSNSPVSVKSTSAPVIIVEEPDDTATDVKGQGDSITLLRDRAKTYGRYKFIIGGTPTVDDFSAIQNAYKRSDQRKLFVPCGKCGEEHVLTWENVRWDETDDIAHEIYGQAQPETARYHCPHCDAAWSDYDKNENVRRACRENRWRATAAFNGVAGFGYLSELYVHWPKSAFAYLVRRYLEAKHEADAGNDEKLKAFYNSTLGIPYSYGGQKIDLEEIRQRALDYAEDTVPRGALLLTAGVDVQHNRFAVTIRGWGRGEESWLVYFGEIYAGIDGAGGVNDRSDPVWQELEQRLFRPYRHAAGRAIHVSAFTIDASDGNTSDAVYGWARDIQKRYPGTRVIVGKGASDNSDREIFSLPKPIDHKSQIKANRYGLRVYQVGTQKAKDLILGGAGKRGRVHLVGSGPGRFHFYEAVRADYLEQLLNSEVKAPSRRLRGRLVWQLRAGRRNEALDCEVYALHSARALKTHIAKPEEWDALEKAILQGDLFNDDTAQPVIEPTPPEPAEASAPEDDAAAPSAPPTVQPPPRMMPPARGGGFVNRWRQGT